jgi:hypothetical protein
VPHKEPLLRIEVHSAAFASKLGVPLAGKRQHVFCRVALRRQPTRDLASLPIYTDLSRRRPGLADPVSVALAASLANPVNPLTRPTVAEMHEAAKPRLSNLQRGTGSRRVTRHGNGSMLVG